MSSAQRVSADALTFCTERRIVQHLVTGINLARRHFSADAGIRVYLEHDPEDLDEYVVLKVNSSRRLRGRPRFSRKVR